MTNFPTFKISISEKGHDYGDFSVMIIQWNNRGEINYVGVDFGDIHNLMDMYPRNGKFVNKYGNLTGKLIIQGMD